MAFPRRDTDPGVLPRSQHQRQNDWRHYLSLVQRKPGALRNGAPISDLPEGFRRLQALFLKRPGGDREMVDVLALMLLHDERLVEQAIPEALWVQQPSRQ